MQNASSLGYSMDNYMKICQHFLTFGEEPTSHYQEWAEENKWVSGVGLVNLDEFIKH